MHVDRLAENLISESKAYGYTLTIWGSGAILISKYGVPNTRQIFLYIGAAVAAFAVLAAVAFRNLLGDVDTDSSQHLVIVSMVHVVATLGNLGLIYALVVTAKGSGLSAAPTFALVGFVGTVAYNVGLLLEDRMARIVTWFGRNADVSS